MKHAFALDMQHWSSVYHMRSNSGNCNDHAEEETPGKDKEAAAGKKEDAKGS